MKDTKISVIGCILLILLIMLLNQSCTDCGTYIDDGNVPEKLREILIMNIALNNQYKEFYANQTAKTPFSEMFSNWEYLAKEKGYLYSETNKLKVAKRYSRLARILKEALRNDLALLVAKQESLKLVISSLDVFKIDTTKIDKQKSEEDKSSQAIKELYKLKIRLNEWQKKSKTLTAVENSLRSNSIQAIKMLNEELNKLGLPYKHENPYKEEIKNVIESKKGLKLEKPS